MSEKRLDAKNRWRNVVVAFRMSPEEAQELNVKVALSGLSKQDYIIQCLLKHEVRVVAGKKVARKMEMYLAQSQILVVKKSYDRMERLDIKPQIEKYNFNIDDSVDIVVSAGARSNISPAILMDGYMEYINEKVPYDVKRVKILYN